MGDEAKIRWSEWEPGVFSRAETQGKLVFLDISASWCHWCHVLDRTSLSDPRVIRLLNEEFIPVRVDTDRRPDINERYNQGGWPTTAVLLPNGQVLTGATYLPPDALFEILDKCSDFYRRDRMRIDRHLRENESPPGQDEAAGEGSPPRGPLPEDLPWIKQSVLAHYDPDHPGFFREPKFLVTDILGFLRDAWFLEGSREMGDTFRKVLKTMGSSAVFDPVEGGFFRYATRRDWTVPHYEKLLADNAEMLSLCASAYEKAGEAVFARIAGKILRFLLTRLYDPRTGAFFSSQDADEEYFPLDEEGRSSRIPPGIDRTIISEYNGSAVSALVSAHRSFGAGKDMAEAGGGSLLDRAERLAGFLRGTLWSGDDGQIRFREGEAAESGHLSDNVSVAAAYLDLREASGKSSYLEWAGRPSTRRCATSSPLNRTAFSTGVRGGTRSGP